MQCDVCVPPVVTVSEPDQLRKVGWVFRSDGAPLDVCVNCTAHIAPRNRVRRGDSAPVEPDPDRLPNVVVVGAMKAGTTSMYHYLDLHPDIAVSTAKEMRFFTDPDHRSWLGVYQDHFPTGTRYRAEASPHYTKTPCMPGVVDRMADLLPDARLIYLVRDPVERTIAEYVEQKQWHAVTGSLDEELADATYPGNPLVASSRYATQLEELLRRYPQEQVLVLDVADLGADPVGTMARVFGFLDLEVPAFTAEDYVRHNTREDKHQVPGWVIKVRRGAVGRLAQRIPAGPRRLVSHAAWRRRSNLIERPVPSPAVEQALRDHLRPEVERLRALTGLALDGWQV